MAARVLTIESNYVTTSGVGSYATQSYVNNTVANSTSSLSSSVQTLQATVGGHTTSITNFSSSIDGVRAKYGVTIDNNNAITGFEINSGGGGSNFIVKADNFKVYTGSGNVAPFSVSGSTVTMANAVVTGSLAIGSSPVRSGTGMTGSGAAIANDGTFAFGNSSKSVVWDGSALTINGSIISTGNIVDNAVSQQGGSSANNYIQSNGVLTLILQGSYVTPGVTGSVNIIVSVNAPAGLGTIMPAQYFLFRCYDADPTNNTLISEWNVPTSTSGGQISNWAAWDVPGISGSVFYQVYVYDAYSNYYKERSLVVLVTKK